MMTVSNAKSFIKRIHGDKDLRKKLNCAVSPEIIHNILQAEQMDFNEEHFIEAHSYLLANAPTPEAADELRELQHWWNIINNS